MVIIESCGNRRLAAAIAAGLTEPLVAARLAGSAEALRDKSGMEISGQERGMLKELLAPARRVVTPQAWEAEFAAGRALSDQEVLPLMRTATQADGQV